MNLSFTTLVTDEPPRVKLSGRLGEIPLIHFGTAATGTFDVQLPNSMTPDQKASWLLWFARDLNDLAARIHATVAP